MKKKSPEKKVEERNKQSPKEKPVEREEEEKNPCSPSFFGRNEAVHFKLLPSVINVSEA